MIITVACGDPAIGAQITRTYDAAPVHNHSPADVASFFTGLDLINPGIADARGVETRLVYPGPVHRTRRANPGRDRPQTRPRRRGGPVMTGDPPVTLESLDFEWGDAYLICYARDQWAALRRDTRQFLTAQTLDELAARIDADYAASPVPRDVDPPGTADYLDAPSADEDQDDAPDEDDAGRRAGTGTGRSR